MNRTIVKLATFSVMAISLMFPATALADAGKAIFVYGKAFVVSADGDRRALVKGAAVDSGETVITSSNGRVQLQMEDGGLLALRPGTEFVIEQFRMPLASADPVAAFSADDNTPRSFFTLVKGGFRSITGAIGKENKANYRVRTPVATIGIRGTDYDAVFCAGDCDVYSKVLGRTVENGLYVGVNSGGVKMTTDAGSLDLDAGEFGVAKSASSVPSRSADAAEMLSASTTAAVSNNTADDSAVAANPDTGLEASDEAGNDANLVEGDVSAPSFTGSVAFSAYPGNDASGVTGGSAANQVRDADGNLVGFNDGAEVVSLQGGSPVNVGRDTDRDGATGLSWGRWSDGNVQLSDGSSAPIDGSVHYVAGEAGAAAPVVPTTGSANFELVGNTDPTDNRGNVGTLGSADLSADFDNQTVDADVSLSFQETNEVWNASAQDVDINSADATFEGDFDNVSVTSDTGMADGSGNLGGFFSGDDNGNVDGAGMTFTLEEGQTEVNGSAAFQVEPESP